MIHWLSNLIGAVAAIWLISSGLVYMMSPKRGGEMLKRLGVFLAGALVGICLLRQFAACIGPLSLFLLSAVIIIAAYFIWEARRGRSQRQAAPHRGAERTPILPQHHEEDQ
jgi:Ca2+/Na+ antiporter